MKTLCALVSIALYTAAVQAQAASWQQCGGTGWTGATTCVSGNVCTKLNDYYWQCIPGSSSVQSTPPPPSSTPSSTPSSSPSSPPPSSAPSSTPSQSPTSLPPPPPPPSSVSSSAPLPSGSCTSPPPSAGKLKYTGVNIAGFDFGCNVDGNCQASAAWPPLTKYYGMDGQGQMNHFVKDDGFNVFRLPVGWQFFVGDNLGGPVVDANFREYDDLMQACTGSGAAACILDIHNYARWGGKIIGQGGPTNEQFAALWADLAGRYANNTKVIFGVMNEPHDVPDINLWAQSVQAAVTAIRNAGAKTQLILLPGNDWTSAATFVSNGSADALSKVTNPDGTTTGLIFDVHKYLDYDNSGTHPECTTNNIDNAWAPLAQWLRCHGRQAFNTETGGGNVASCEQYMCEQVAYQNANSDVFLGYVGWAAGNFYPTYVLSEIPTDNGGIWSDTPLVSACMIPK